MASGRPRARLSPSSAVAAAARLLILFFIIDHGFFLIVIAFFVHWGELQWVTGDDLQLGPALVARHDLAFFYIVNVNIQRVVTLWANDRHKTLLVL
jgi:hypothetical protein